MSRLARPATRLATGSTLLAHRLATRAATWCARGRRSDLTGWRAALGILARLALLLLGAYLLARLVRALPALMWLLSAGWTLAAWRTGRPAPAQPEAPTDTAPVPDQEAVRTLLLDVMGEAPAVHLRTVLAHLQHKGHWEGRKVGDLRAALVHLNIPHDRRVKVAGVPTWGVRRRDLQTPSADEPQQASPTPSTAA